MAFLTVVIHESERSATQMARDFDRSNKRESLKRIMQWCRRVLVGQAEAYVTSQVAGAQATATVTCTHASAVDGTDILTLAGVALAMVASPSTDVQWAKGTTNATMAANLAARINTNPTTQKLVRAKAISNVCHIFALVPGLSGNFLTLAETGGGMVISGALLAGGTSDEADSMIFGFNPQL